MDALIKLTPELFPELCDGLLREMDPKISAAMWHRLLIDHASPEHGGGYVLTANGQFVGLIGAIYSERMVQGKKARFCNIHSWYVRPEYRGQSMLLLRPFLRLKGYTVTDLSPTKGVVKILRRLGFEVLDSHAWLLLPMRRRKSELHGESVMQPLDADSAEVLSESDRQIFEDHQLEHCRHLLLRDGDAYCYVVCSRLKHVLFHYGFVHYISDRRRFLKHLPAVRVGLMEATQTKCVTIDSRQLAGVKPDRAIRIATYDKLYRPGNVAREDIDSLYSDTVNLCIPTLPRARRLVLSPLLERLTTLRSWQPQASILLADLSPDLLLLS
jgi:hypothetical protein